MLVVFGFHLFGSDGYEFIDYFAVRPVVYLQSDIGAAELTISPNGKEEPWNSESGSEFGNEVEEGQIGESH